MKHKKSPRCKPVIEVLEARLLYSATVDVVLVDGALADQEMLEAAAQDADHYFVYDSTQDSAADIIAEVTLWAEENQQKIDSLSIISHGDDGQFQLGNEDITAESIGEHTDVWEQLGDALDENANIYLYGCETGQGEQGQVLLDALADAAHADVFASDDITGSDGDWDLEAASDGDESELQQGLMVPISAQSLQSYSGTLASTVFKETNDITGDWTNVSNIRMDDGSYATGTIGQQMFLGDFNYENSFSGLNIKSIDGIEIKGQADRWTETPEVSLELSWDGGTSWTSSSHEISWSTGGIGWDDKTTGGSSDTWGRTWSESELYNANFQVRITAINDHSYGDETYDYDYFYAKVHYTLNQAPVLANNSLTVDEGETVVLSASDLSATDGDDNDSDLTFTVGSVSNGQFEEVSNAGVAITNFTQSQITSSEIQFVHDNSETAPSFNVSVSDGVESTVAAATSITFAIVDDAPINSVPGAQSTQEDTSLTFSAANGNAITVDNEDDAAADLQVTLSVINGTLTLNAAQTGPLTFSSGDGTADTSMTFVGTAAEINAALEGMSYDPAASYVGSADITLVTTDIETNPLDNDASAQAIYQLSDATDALSNSADITLGAEASFVTDGTRGDVLSVDGVDDYAALPSSLTSGLSVFSFSFWVRTTENGTGANFYDQPALIGFENAGGGNDMVVTTSNGYIGFGHALNGGDQQYLSGTTQINDDAWHLITVSNDGSNARLYVDGTLETTISSGNSLNSTQFYLGAHNNTSTSDSFHHQGSFDEVRFFDKALSASEVTDIYNGPLSTTDTVNISVTGNTAPVLSGLGGTLSYTEGDGAQYIDSDITLADTNETYIESATIQITGNFQTGEDTLAIDAGNVVAGVTVSAFNTINGTLTITADTAGTITKAQFEAMLEKVTYTNSSDNADTGDRTISWTVNDGDLDSNVGSSTIEVSAFDDAPVNSLPASQSVQVSDDLVFSSGNGNAITITDADSSTISVTLNSSNGALTLSTVAGLSFSSGDGTSDAVMTFSGTVAAINTALEGMTFSPAAEGAASITVTSTSTQSNAIYNFEVNETSDIFGDNDLTNSGASQVADPDGGSGRGGVLQTTGNNALDAGEVLIDQSLMGADDSIFSVGFWVKTGDSGGGTYLTAPSLLGTYTDLVNDGRLNLWLHTDGTLRLSSDLNSGNTSLEHTSSGVVVNDNTWHHISLTNDGADLSLYIDGGFKASLSSGDDLNAQNIALGGRYSATLGYTTYGINAYFDDLRVGETAWSAANILDTATTSAADYGVDTDTLSITVNNTAPVINDATASNLSESATNGTSVYNVNEANTGNDTDQDGTALTYSISSGNDDNIFAINSSTGEITVDDNTNLNYESTTQYVLTVSATDGDTADAADITINIDNVDDTAASIVNSSVTLNEGANVTLSTTEFSATDVDTTDTTLIYTVGNVTNGSLTINGSAWVGGGSNDSFSQQDIIDGKVVYTHDGSNTTSDSFSFTVKDPAGNILAGQTFSITVNAVDDDTATIVNNSVSLNEGANVTLSTTELSATDADTTDTALIYTVGNVTNGSLTINGGAWVGGGTNDSFTQQDIISGNVVYTHDGTNTSSDSFSFTVADPAGNTLGGQTFSITVNAVDDDTATIVNNSVTLNEGANVTLSTTELSATDADTTDTSLIYTVGNVTNGSLTINGGAWVGAGGNDTFTQQDIIDGKVVYTHDGSNTTSDGFSFTVEDPAGNTLAGQTFSITVNAIDDDAPTVVNSSMITVEAAVVTLSLAELSANDADTDNASLIYTVGNVTNGSLTINGGAWVGGGNDTFTQQDIIDGNVVYTHDGSNTVSDNFTYTVEDPAGNTLVGQTFSIAVNAVDDDAPTVVNNSVTLNEGANVTLSAADLSATDVDTTDNTLIYVVGDVTNGSLSINGSAWVNGANDSFTQQDIIDGKVVYSHNGSETTSDSFSFLVKDPSNNTLVGQSFSITVNAVDDTAPTLVNSSVTLNEGAGVTLTTGHLGATDSEAADSSLVYTVTAPSNGTLTINGSAWANSTNDSFTQQDIIDGKVVYTHDGSDTIGDSLSFSVKDPNNNILGGQTFVITVNPLDDTMPSLVNNSVTLDEGTAVTLTAGHLSGTDTESSDTALLYIVSAPPPNGSLTINGSAWAGGSNDSFTQQDIIDGNVVYTHDGSNTTSDSLSFSLRDQSMNTLGGLALTINVNAIDDTAPVLADSSVTLNEGAGVTLTTSHLSATDTEAADASLVYTVSAPTNGTLTINGSAWANGSNDSFTQQDIIDGNVVYTHDGSNTTSDSLSFSVKDPDNNTLGGQSFTINVSAVNDLPVNTVPGMQSVNEGETLVFSAGNGNAITVADSDNASLNVTLSVNDGTLTLASTAGLTVSGDGSSQIVLSGSTANINAALDGLIFSSDALFGGTSTLTVITGDGLGGDPAIVAKYTFETDGGDDSGNSNDATLNNGAAIAVDGSRGNVISLDGGSEYVEMPAALSSSLANTFTVSFWVKTSESGTSALFYQRPTMLGMSSSGFGSDDFWINTNDGYIGFGHGLDGMFDESYLSATTQVNDDQWHLISVSNDGSNASLYVDGVFEHALDSGSNLDGQAFYLGAMNANGTDRFYHQGLYDDVQFFGRALSVAEIETLYGCGSDSDTVAIEVNALPVVANNSVTLNEGANVTLSTSELSATDVDIADTSLIYTVGDVTNGSLTINGSAWANGTNDSFTQQDIIDGKVVYTHDDSNTTSDSFSFTVEDPTGTTLAGQTFSITVDAVDDDTATIVNNSVTLNEGANVTLSTTELSATDTDTTDTALIYTVGDVTNGSLTINGGAWVNGTNDSFTQQDIVDGKVVYTHDGSNTTSDSFSFTVEDPAGNTLAGQTVSITVNAVDDDTAAMVNNSVTVNEGANITLSATELSATDADTDDTSLIYTVGNVANGSLTINGSAWVNGTNDSFTQQDIIDGKVLYTHDGSNTSSDSFSFTVEDPAGNTLSGQTFSINVNAVDDAPVASDDEVTVSEGNSLNIKLISNDTDNDSIIDPASITIISGPVNGSLTINNDGTVDYQHDGGETTNDSFTYTIKDAAGNESNVALVTVNVTAVNNSPVVNNTSVTTDENAILHDVVPVATDVEGNLDTNGYSLNTDVEEGTLIFNSDGSYSIDPGNDFDYLGVGESRDISFTYTATDTDGAISAPATVTITVTGSDDLSIISGEFSATISEAAVGDTTEATGSITITDADSSDTPAFAATAINGTYGSLLLNGSGNWTYTLDQNTVQDLDAGDTVIDIITLTADNGMEQEITIAIDGTNDQAVVTGELAGVVTEGDIGEITTVSGAIAIGDIDADDNPSFVSNAQSGTYGDFVLDSVGKWTYTLDQARVQGLSGIEDVSDNFLITATDNTVQNIIVTINGVDDSPIVDAGENQNVYASETVMLDASGVSDIDDDVLVYEWTQVSGPAVILNDHTSSQPTFVAPAALENQEIVFELTVSDGTSSVVDRVSVNVMPQVDVTETTLDKISERDEISEQQELVTQEETVAEQIKESVRNQISEAEVEVEAETEAAAAEEERGVEEAIQLESDLDSNVDDGDESIPSLSDFLRGSDVVPEIIALSERVVDIDEDNDVRIEYGDNVAGSIEDTSDVGDEYFFANSMIQSSEGIKTIKIDSQLWSTMESLSHDIEQEDNQKHDYANMLKGASLAAASLVAGGVLRGAALSSSMFAVLPVWRIDPVAVLSYSDERDEDREDFQFDQSAENTEEERVEERVEAMFSSDRVSK